jgi:hypothetical protein
MTIKEEIQIEEYKRAFAEAYKQGIIDAMSMMKRCECSEGRCPYMQNERNGVLFRGKLEEGDYKLIKTTDGWVLQGEDIVFCGWERSE